MKKGMGLLLLLMTVVCWAMGLPGGQVQAETATVTGTYGDFVYQTECDLDAYGYVIVRGNEEVTITGYKGSGGEVVIPDTIGGGQVKVIGNSAFSGCSGLTSVSIPKGVTSIKLYAFYGCSSLTSVSIPASVTSIGRNVFKGCTGLESITVAAENLTYGSWQNCNAIIERSTGRLIIGCKNTTIPEDVTSIGYDAFSGCSGLTSVNIPEGVTSIGASAFADCRSLTSVNIPENVTSIEHRVFEGCTGLESITVAEGNLAYGSWQDCNAIIKRSTGQLIAGCKNTTIPEDVTSIGDYAFSGCSELTSVSIPGSVTSIGEYAFSECTSLNKVTFPDSVTEIGRHAFWRCTSLREVTLPDRVTSIEYGTFSGCTSLEKVTIPEGVEVIQESAFTACDNLKGIMIPESVKDMGMESKVIDEHTIIYCLANSVAEEYAKQNGNDYVIVASVEEGNRMIDQRNQPTDDETGDSGQEDQSVTPEDPVVTPEDPVVTPDWTYDTLQDGTLKLTGFSSSLIDSKGRLTIPGQIDGKGISVLGEFLFKDRSDLTAVVVGEGIKEMEKWCFYNCNKLTTIELPDTLEKIGTGAFYGCQELESIVLPDRITNIEGLTFAECFNLKRVKIDDAVTSIAENAFLNCTSLEGMVLPAALQTIHANALSGVTGSDRQADFVLTVPEQMEDVSTVGLEKLSNISNITVFVVEGSSAELYLQQFQYIVVRSYEAQQPATEPESAEKPVEQEGAEQPTKSEGTEKLTEQEDTDQSTKSEGTEKRMEQEGTDQPTRSEGTEQSTKQEIGATTETVSEVQKPQTGKTYTVNGLKYKVVSNQKVTFTGASKKTIRTLQIPAAVRILGQSFQVTAIGKRALKQYSTLTTVVIGKNVQTIGDEAFMKCTRLTKVTFGKNVKKIGKKAFYGDKKMKRFVFKGKKLTSVGKKALRGMSAIDLVVPDKKTGERYKKLLKKAK